MGGAGDAQMEGAGGSGEASAPTTEDRLAQVQAQLAQMHNIENQLRMELEDAGRNRGPDRGRQL